MTEQTDAEKLADLNDALRYYSLKPEYGGSDEPAHKCKEYRDIIWAQIKEIEGNIND